MSFSSTSSSSSDLVSEIPVLMSQIHGLISELDKMGAVPHKKLGEKGHTEYGWSSDIREKILQFYYQCCRVKDTTSLKKTYISLLKKIFESDIPETDKYNFLVILYKMIAQTRDIISGKGEYTLSYMMISVWANPQVFCSAEYHEMCVCLAKYALVSFVQLECDSESQTDKHPLGSWKDVKYFLNYLINDSGFVNKNDKHLDINNQQEIVQCAIYLINNQLKTDEAILNDPDSDKTKLSLVSKWIPREKSNKFGWINDLLAYHYYKVDNWYLTCKNEIQKEKARLKAKTNYRKLISKINKEIGTVQIKQCNKTWSTIDFDKNVTSITMSKQKLAFTNKTKRGLERYEDEDRQQCANNFNTYIQNCQDGSKTMKGKRVSIYDFVKDALSCNEEQLIKTINLQWNDNLKQNDFLKNMIAMVDVSSSMSCENNTPMFNAIGLGIRIAQLSSLGKRVMTFSSRPSWVSLDNCDNFVDMVKLIRKAEWGTNTNFYAAFDMILDAYIKLDKDPDEVENITLVILSDMQIDQASDKKLSMDTMFEVMEEKFADAGKMSRFNKPFKLPTIVFWNLRSTDGFPTTSTTKNTVMVTGYSPVIMNAFVENGVTSVIELNPWNSMVNILNHQRYKSYEKLFSTYSGKFYH